MFMKRMTSKMVGPVGFEPTYTITLLMTGYKPVAIRADVRL